MSTETTDTAPVAAPSTPAPKPKKSAAEEIALLKARLDEAQTQLDDSTALVKRQSQTIEVLRAEKQSWVADEGLRQTAGNELLNTLNGLRAQVEQQAAEIARQKAALNKAGTPELAAQVTAMHETASRLNLEVSRLKAENARLRTHQGSHTALTSDQVKARIKADPRTKFMAIAPYSHGTLNAVRGQIYEGRHFPHLAEHVGNGLLLVVVEDALSSTGAAA